LAHAFLLKYSYERLKLDQLLGQLGVFLTWICGMSIEVKRSPGMGQPLCEPGTAQKPPVARLTSPSCQLTLT
jgi:hypothetical protein